MKLKNNFLLTLLIGATTIGFSQSPVSGFMKQKGKGAVALSYSFEKYNEVYLIPSLVKGVPVFEEVQNTSINIYSNYGITDKLEAVLSVPYIKSEGKGNATFLAANEFENTRQGFQDATIFLKYKAYSFRTIEATYDLILSTGVQTPIGDYKADEGLQSIIAIGNRGTKTTGLAILQVKLDKGYFITGQAGYRISTNKVPSAFVSEAKVGYASSKIYVDAWFALQKSSKSVDILQPGFSGFFPETQVDYSRIGANIYAPIYKGFGINLGLNAFVKGRNLGKSAGYTTGLVYNF